MALKCALECICSAVAMVKCATWVQLMRSSDMLLLWLNSELIRCGVYSPDLGKIASCYSINKLQMSKQYICEIRELSVILFTCQLPAEYGCFYLFSVILANNFLLPASWTSLFIYLFLKKR